MKEIPIIFQPEIIRAILDGVCNLTFRVIKPQPTNKKGYAHLGNEQWRFFYQRFPDGNLHDNLESEQIVNCPYGQVGDRLWVRETFCYQVDPDTLQVSHNDFWYRASDEGVVKCDDDGSIELTKAGWEASPWRPSIHMPRWASRITLERSEPAYVKRTLDITEEEAKLCGFESDAVIVNTPAGKDYTGLFALDRYMAYWDLLNKARGFPFADNVWVWGVPFGAVSYRGK